MTDCEDIPYWEKQSIAECFSTMPWVIWRCNTDQFSAFDTTLVEVANELRLDCNKKDADIVCLKAEVARLNSRIQDLKNALNAALQAAGNDAKSDANSKLGTKE